MQSFSDKCVYTWSYDVKIRILLVHHFFKGSNMSMYMKTYSKQIIYLKNCYLLFELQCSSSVPVADMYNVDDVLASRHWGWGNFDERKTRQPGLDDDQIMYASVSCVGKQCKNAVFLGHKKLWHCSASLPMAQLNCPTEGQ